MLPETEKCNFRDYERRSVYKNYEDKMRKEFAFQFDSPVKSHS